MCSLIKANRKGIKSGAAPELKKMDEYVASNREGVGMKIMVVDDEMVQIESLRRGLRSKRFDVVEALNGQEAMTRLNDENGSIDMVITDYSMPGMNGIDLLRKIREKDISLPVIMMTAYGEKDLVIEAMRNDCDSFIEKPFTLEMLMKEIDRAMLKAIENKNSRELSRMVPEFVHQINNPLFSISAGAELALGDLERNNTDGLKDRMNRIIKATEKITEINSAMRKFGSERQSNSEEMDINGLLDDCIKMFSDMLKLKGISVEKKLHNGDLLVSGSRFEMEQVFKNLILNAIHSMGETQEKRLLIGSELNKDSHFVSVRIEDTGCGIPEESLDRIFRPYFTTKEKGTGLGLAVIKGIVDKHKGMIDVKSIVCQGTRFDVTLKASALQ